MSLLKKQKNNQKLSTKLTRLYFGRLDFMVEENFFLNLLTFNKEKQEFLPLPNFDSHWKISLLKVRKVQKGFLTESYFSQRNNHKIVHKIDP